MLFQNLTQAFASFVIATTILSFLVPGSAFGQNSESTIAEHLKFGEYSKALEHSANLPSNRADASLAAISNAQSDNGASDAATATIASIKHDKIRFKALAQQQLLGGPGFNQFGGIGGPGLGVPGFGNNGFGNQPNGQGAGGRSGGVTLQDFQPLINLIRTTIDPDSWDDANGDGTIQAYPAGVYADSTGTLQKIKLDPKRSLTKLAANSSFDSGNRAVHVQSNLRKISLNRLEKHLQFSISSGQPITNEFQNLAGIYEIKYLMFLPESNDIVIAGPAGPWSTDVDGHAVNIATGKPVLQLDDLVVCLRNVQRGPQGNNGKFGCSITPRKQNLAATREYISTTKLRGKAWRTRLRETLGQQDIEVFGIDPATHAGMVLVEADYRMKLVAMGLEPSIPEIPSYLSRLDLGPDGKVEPMDVVRWWFTMNYDEIVSDDQKQVFELNGTGVKVLSENEFIDQQGERIHTGQSDGPTAGFARDFTRHFEKIADQYPCYRRLKNLFDLSIVSALIRSQRLDRKAGWNLTYFGNNPEQEGLVYQPKTAPVPTQVDSVMNHRIIKKRKQSSTVKHTLVGVSGGITFDAVSVLRTKASVATDSTPLLTAVKHAKENDADSRNWWWD